LGEVPSGFFTDARGPRTPNELETLCPVFFATFATFAIFATFANIAAA
jgi:hypothetical protein